MFVSLFVDVVVVVVVVVVIINQHKTKNNDFKIWIYSWNGIHMC